VRGLPRLDDLTAPAERRFKEVAARLDAALQRNTDIHARDLLKVTARLSPDTLHRQRADCGRRVEDLGRRLDLAARRVPERVAQHARLPALQERMNACARAGWSARPTAWSAWTSCGCRSIPNGRWSWASPWSARPTARSPARPPN
jgi:exonuclease VII large subunit